jgi:ABC-type uncharacterized transport system involved in gliding motility auxiliary subunit
VKQIVGLLGWLGVVLVLAAVALRAGISAGFLDAQLMPWASNLAIAGLVVTGLYALSQWRDIARSFQGKHVRYGAMALGSVVVFLAILVAINWISNRRNMRWDLTEAQQFTLSDQTAQILGALEQPLVIRAFYGGDMPAQVVSDPLSEYEYLSDQVEVQYIDAFRDPVRAEQDTVTALPTLILQYGGRTERTSATDEQSLTNALKKLVEGEAKKIYFIQGHGEHDISASDTRGYTSIASQLANDNFEVDTLTLAQTGVIPDDATIVAVAGPRTDYFEPELDAIRDFLAQGGKLLMMLDPPASGDAPPLTGLTDLAREWAIDVGTNLVVDQSGIGQIFGGGAETPVAMPVAHPITNGMQVITAHPLARSVTPVDAGVDGRFAQRLAETGPASWAEADLDGLFSNGQPEQDLASGDLAGPVSLAAAVSAPVADAAPPAPDAPDALDAPPNETRVVVVGDSDFVGNSAVGISGNGDLFLNMANWLAQQENLIAIRPRDPEDRRISLTNDQIWMIQIATIFVIPGLLFAAAVGVWWRRR